MRSVKGRFYHSKTWENCRQSYLVTHSLCERCLAKGKIVPAKIVHHKTYLDDRSVENPEIALNHENLEALCQDCHNREHFGEKVEPRFFFGDEGELIIKGDPP